MSENEFFRTAMLEVQPRFDINKADKNVLNSIFAWVWRDQQHNFLGLEFDKGLWFFGSLGRGKSMTLLGLRKYLIGLHSRRLWYNDTDYRLGTYWKTASELANLYAVDGQTALMPYINPECCLFIDELGREPNPSSNYGTKMNVMQFLLQIRYDHRRQCVTHVTTNLHIEQIADHYGDYVADRCLEMFNFIEFKGDSLR